eukprot:COSAG05_NODE_4277_length_1586_cov_1.306658_4_plen_49_part_01
MKTAAKGVCGDDEERGEYWRRETGYGDRGDDDDDGDDDDGDDEENVHRL